jgi:hypothetical protein
MLDWDSKIESEWDEALDKYNNYLTSPEKSSRDARVTITNAYTVSLFTTEEFFKYLHDEFFVWKYTAKNRLATARSNLKKMALNDLTLIKEALTNPSLNDEELLDAGLKIKGLGCAGATALLSTLYPNRFGTVDQFVIKCLQKADSLSNNHLIAAINPDSIKKNEALYVLKLIRDKADELNGIFSKKSWSPRTVDKAVWAAR